MPFLVTLAAAQGAPECATPTTAVDLQLTLDQAELSFEARDRSAVLTADADALRLIPCLAETVTPALAGRLHRVEAFASFLRQDSDAALASLLASRAAAPGYVLPTTLVPAGHPLRVAFDSAVGDPAAFEPVPPVEGSVRIDGSAALVHATDRPALVQVLDAAGAVTLTRLLGTGELLAVLALPPPTPASPLDLGLEPPVLALARAPEARRSTRTGPHVALLATSGVLLLGSGALYGGALAARGDYEEATRQDDIEAAYALNHFLVITAGVVGGAGVVMGASAFIEGRW